MYFETFILTILFKNAKLNIKKKKKKKKATQVFLNFGSLGKGQTNIFFFLGLMTKPLIVLSVAASYKFVLKWKRQDVLRKLGHGVYSRSKLYESLPLGMQPYLLKKKKTKRIK